MNISRKLNAENNMLISESSILAYYFHCDINILLQSTEKKASLKNYWLQKKEIKNQVKEHDAKLDEIARFVTKYINNRKSHDKG